MGTNLQGYVRVEEDMDLSQGIVGSYILGHRLYQYVLFLLKPFYPLLLQHLLPLHHPDFDIEKTKRYLILLLIGLVHNESFKQANHSNLSKLVNSMENIVEAELGIETPWLFPHVLPIDLDDLSYQQILEEVLDYNPPLKNEKAIDLYIRKKMSFRLYKDYYDLYQYFNNKRISDFRLNDTICKSEK